MSSDSIIVISQPRYLPSLNYIHRILLADKFIFLDNVQYTPRDWENRNKVKGPNGAFWLTVPVVRVSREQRILDTKIDSEQRWANRHINTIKQLYSSAPFFSNYIGDLCDIYQQEWEYLIDLNERLIKYFCKSWDISYNFIRASEMNVIGSGENLLIGLCQKVNGTIYLSGELGKNYINPDHWARANLGLTFHKYNYPKYSQLHGDFIPWVSAIDLLMNCGRSGREILLSGQPLLEK